MVLLANAGFFAASGSTFDDEGAWHAINSILLASNTASVSMTSAGSEKPWSDYQDLMWEKNLMDKTRYDKIHEMWREYWLQYNIGSSLLTTYNVITKFKKKYITYTH